MTTNNIIIKNAHTNNLKNVDVELPKHSIVPKIRNYHPIHD